MPFPFVPPRQALAGLALTLLAAVPGCRAGTPASGDRPSPRTTAALAAADSLFQLGHFADAAREYAVVAADQPEHLRALTQLGRIAVLSNQFAEAEDWLGRARRLAPDDSAVVHLLAEVWYRQDRFADVAGLLRGRGNDIKVQVLDGFRGRVPYQIEGPDEETSLRFAQTDPIPVVTVRVNGHDANFIIDTGASEVYLEPEFAKRAGAVLAAGSAAQGFAGGQTKEVQRGRIDSLGLGAFTVRNLPVNIVDTKFIGRDEVAKGLNVAGFIGTVLLYHFLPTLDYPGGQLTLRRKSVANLKAVEALASREGHTVVPFWLTGDHFMVTWASANGSQPSLFLIDTGGAGIGFVPGPSFVKEAGIVLPPTGDEKIGAVPIRRFTADQVSLGGLTERAVPAIFGAFPAFLETSTGFRLAGIVSHAFFRHYAVTMDFTGMRYLLRRRP